MRKSGEISEPAPLPAQKNIVEYYAELKYRLPTKKKYGGTLLRNSFPTFFLTAALLVLPSISDL